MKFLRAGIVGSSGGSALRAAVECMRSAGYHVNLCVITDRDCGLRQWARDEQFPTHDFDYENADMFSSKVADTFAHAGVNQALLFYTRRISAPFIDAMQVCNIHPSLLPAFPGLRAVERAIAEGAPVLGSTLHAVDAGLDTGPIIAQVARPLVRGMLLKVAERISYQQKVYLTLLWFERVLGSAVLPGARSATSNVSSSVTTASVAIADSALLHAYCMWCLNVTSQFLTQGAVAS